MDKRNNEIIDLWPTRIFQKHLNEFKEYNNQLLNLIDEMYQRHAGLTTDYRNSNLLEIDTIGTTWLRQSINEAVIKYLRSMAIDYPVDWQIHAWPNINKLGDYHDPHNHPRCYLSGTYYLKIPLSREIGSREDLRPNRITLYDPRLATNMNSIKNDLNIDPEYTILPKPGFLMLWPSFLSHFVHPNLSKEKRISISFNIILKWSDHYLPDQNY